MYYICIFTYIQVHLIKYLFLIKYLIKYLISTNIFIYIYIYIHISDSYMNVITDDNPTFPENLLIKTIESIIKT